jgi:hypothetical protein
MSQTTNRAGILGLLVLATQLAGCYPGDLTSVEDADIVVTAYDEGFDFSTVSTWAMPDSVVAVSVDNPFAEYGHLFDAEILAAVESHMNALGYTREADPETNGADLVVLVQAAVSDIYGAYSFYPFDASWGWYPGWSHWGGTSDVRLYYPWSDVPAGVDLSDVPTGSIIIELVDPNAPVTTPNGPAFTVRWAAVLNGLAADITDVSRVTGAIDQAFAQSPHLGT